MRLSPKTETISISLPGWLIDLLDETCHIHDITRSAFIKIAIKNYLLQKNNNPNLWEELYSRVIGK